MEVSQYVSSHAHDDRLRQVEAVTDTALAHLNVDDLLDELLDRVRELLEVDTAAVLLLDRSGERLVATAARGIEAEVRQGFRLPIGEGFAGRIAAEKRPVFLDRVDHATVLNPVLWEKGIRSLLGVPMLSGGTVTGVLHVGTLSPRRFTDDDADLLRRVADRAALAAQARGSEIDQAAAEALQRSLLPVRLPTRPEVEAAARYVAGEREGVGGDWYDVFTLPSDAIGVVIGDVVGRGLDAAVVMGRLRSALRAYALESEDPAVVLDKLNRKVEHFEPGMMVTVLYAVLVPPYKRLHLSVAGHFPPVLAHPDRPAALLDVPSDPPLGVPVKVRRRTHIIDMPPGTLLCFFTDGLVERRGSSIDENVELLCESVASDDVESVCTTVMAKLVGHEPTIDDITLLALRHKDDNDILAERRPVVGSSYGPYGRLDRSGLPVPSGRLDERARTARPGRRSGDWHSLPRTRFRCGALAMPGATWAGGKTRDTEEHDRVRSGRVNAGGGHYGVPGVRLRGR